MNRLIPLVAALMVGAVQAQTPPTAQLLGNCLTENTTGKERKELARWIFAAMSAHPELRPLSQVSAEDRQRFDQQMAALFTRLMTKDCLEPARAAMREGGPNTFKLAGELLGRVAMAELIADPSVPQAIEAYTKFLDLKAFEDAFRPR